MTAKQLKLSWMRFAFIMILEAALLLLICGGTIYDRDSLWTAGALLSAYVPQFVFVGLGWSRLRRENAASPIDPRDFGKILLHFIGPLKSALIWFGVSMLLPFLVILVWFFARAA